MQFVSGYAAAGRDGEVFEIRVTFKVDGRRSAPRGKIISGQVREHVRPWDRAVGLLALTSLVEEAAGPIEGDAERRHQERLALLQSQELKAVEIEIDGSMLAGQRLDVPGQPMWLVHVDLDGSAVSVMGQNLEVAEVALETIIDPASLLGA